MRKLRTFVAPLAAVALIAVLISCAARGSVIRGMDAYMDRDSSRGTSVDATDVVSRMFPVGTGANEIIHDLEASGLVRSADRTSRYFYQFEEPGGPSDTYLEFGAELWTFISGRRYEVEVGIKSGEVHFLRAFVIGESL